MFESIIYKSDIPNWELTHELRLSDRPTGNIDCGETLFQTLNFSSAESSA